MSDIWVAIIAMVGTAIGSLGGILASSKLTNFRLESLEERVNKHNNMVGRLYKVEDRAKSNSHRLDELEKEYRIP